ncbi:MAG: hypothetical protein K2X77_19900 [Candidatus Obscuribacterales bacterium]|nr:hypothetical protein [Candidatus Obscuribacterales bacterium]
MDGLAECLRTNGPADNGAEQTSAAHLCLNTVARVERELKQGSDPLQRNGDTQRIGNSAQNKSEEPQSWNLLPKLPYGEFGGRRDFPAPFENRTKETTPSPYERRAVDQIPDDLAATEFSAAKKIKSHSDVLTQAQRLEQARAERKLTNDMLDKIERAHFNYFVDHSDPTTGLTKDRSASYSPASIAATGFSLSAHIAASERSWISRDQAADYTLKVLRTLWNAPQSDAAEGTAGYKGFFYHFLELKTAERAWKSELSTIDTALLMAGVLTSQSYFDRNNKKEKEIRDLATKLYDRVDWNWAMQRDRMSLGWHPERGFLPYEWGAYTEAMIMMTLGLGSKTHPIPANSWKKYTDSTNIDKLPDGRKYASFGPLFGHQYSQAWIDYRGIKDDVNRKIGADYFENSRRAVIAQHEYAKKNPNNWRGYSSLDWGLTASDGPGGGGVIEKDFNGQKVKFFGYRARGAPHDFDDGTIAPTAAASSLPFAPELVIPTLKHWTKNRPEIMTPHGFADAFNPSFDSSKNSGWVDTDTIGIDQGPIVMMTENYRSGLFWNLMKKNPTIRRGLQRGGFTGGWLK